MPEIRKLVDLRTTRAVCLPKRWLDYYEAQFGQKIEYVTLEIDHIIKVAPYIPPKKI